MQLVAAKAREEAISMNISLLTVITYKNSIWAHMHTHSSLFSFMK